MLCPKCGGKAKKYKHLKDGDCAYKQLKCLECGNLFHTVVDSFGEIECSKEEFLVRQNAKSREMYRKKCAQRYKGIRNIRGVKVDVGDKLKVSTKVLPIDDIDIELEDLPEYYDAEVISIRKNIRGWSFKFKVYTRWIRDAFDEDCGRYSESYMGYRRFSLPMYEIGKTAHLVEGVQQV